MTSFLYPTSPPSALCNASPLNPSPNSPPDPNFNPNPALGLHDPAVEFPAVERDYMGIGFELKQYATVKEKGSFLSRNPLTASNLCGSDLKLAPPSSDAEADDGEPLSGNVGWPPISSFRKATTRLLSVRPHCIDRKTSQTAPLSTQTSLISDNNDDDQEYRPVHHALDNDASPSKPFPTKPRKPLHIKVSMDGTPIMRKLQLISMQGYQHLYLELCKLFKFYKRNLSCEVGVHSSFKDSKGANFILTYKNKDGDHWMLVGDTPWETFAHAARRIRIMKIEE